MGEEQRARYKGRDDAERYGCFANAAVMRELEMRDWRWLYTGEAPAITYETDEVRRSVEFDRPQEKRTAERLRKHGIPPSFVVDELIVRDDKTGQMKKVGLADFSGGQEIKTLKNASTFNTIDCYIKNASKKRNAIALYFDNTENDSLSDDKLMEFILRSRRFSRGSVYVLTKDEELLKIR